MKKTLIFNSLFLGVVAWGITTIDTGQNALAYFLGGMIVTVNLLLTFYLWKKLFEKKFVALASGLIVFKYAIFGVIIYVLFTKILTSGWTQPIWFGVGVGSGSFGLVLAMYILGQREQKDVI